MSAHDAVEVILAKRDGHELSDSQIDWVVDAYTRGDVADEQMSALAMAILLNGMDRREISRWTAAMIASGERMDFSGAVPADRRQALHRRRRRQDHAAAGAAGRRLRRRRAAAVRARARPHRRHPRQAGVDPRLAGGALQRRDARPAGVGRRGDLRGRRRARAGRQEALRAARRHRHRRGDPADRLARSCRKKIAEGTGALVLDVKVGTGAFMKDVDRARELAETMVALGTDAGVHTVALLTDMDTPLGLTAGNARRGRRVGRGARRRRPRRRGRADPGPGPRDARRRRPRRRRPGRRAAPTARAMDAWRR